MKLSISEIQLSKKKIPRWHRSWLWDDKNKACCTCLGARRTTTWMVPLVFPSDDMDRLRPSMAALLERPTSDSPFTAIIWSFIHKRPSCWEKTTVRCALRENLNVSFAVTLYLLNLSKIIKWDQSEQSVKRLKRTGMGTDKVLKVRKRNLERYKVCVGVWERGRVGKKKMEEGVGKKIVELAIYWERESHDKYIEQLME